MYVIGRSGLYFYKANSGKPPVLVQKGLDFLKNQTLAKTLAGK
jgi:hypothetical protein